jgi:hypothetical protein
MARRSEVARSVVINALICPLLSSLLASVTRIHVVYYNSISIRLDDLLPSIDSYRIRAFDPCALVSPHM